MQSAQEQINEAIRARAERHREKVKLVVEGATRIAAGFAAGGNDISAQDAVIRANAILAAAEEYLKTS